MAWKSGGASHSELIHNLRSKCHPRPMWGNWARLGLDWVPLGRPERSVYAPAPCRLEGTVQCCTSSIKRRALAIASPRDLSLFGDVDCKGRERATGRSWWGRGRRLPTGLGEGLRHRWWVCHSSPPPARSGLAGEGRAPVVGRCWPGLEAGLDPRGPHPRPLRRLAFLLLSSRPHCKHSLPPIQPPPPSVFSSGGRCHRLIQARGGRER